MIMHCDDCSQATISIYEFNWAFRWAFGRAGTFGHGITKNDNVTPEIIDLDGPIRRLSIES